MLGNEEVYNYLVKPENEGFLARPKDIGDGKITLGSGLTDPKWVKLYHQRGDVWSKEDNKMAVMQELEERRKWMEQNVPNWDRLPEASQDSLLSYHYNTGFNRDNSPKLFQALQDFNLQEAARQMDATSKNPKFKKGLLRRRREEQEWFLSGINGTPLAPIPTPVPVPVRRTPIATPATPRLRGEIERHPIYGPIWNNMSPGDQGRLLKMAGDNNISSLDAALPIFRGYLGQLNTHAEGGPLGYNAWKRAIEKQKGIKVSEDNTYDYESYYADNPAAAWAMLGEDPRSHFTDNYKTVYHPTFSTQSNYSGFVNPHNPQGLTGGTWNEKGDTYTMSSDLYNGPVSMDDRINYLIDSEDNGVVLREADGSLPYMGNDTVLGGVLPNVEVNSSKDWNSLSLKEKSDIIRVAIKNGITTLPQIKEKFNEFANGGNLYGDGGYIWQVLPGLLRDAGLDIRVTSGYRKAGAVGKAGTKSWHWRNGAVDIVPQGKTTFEDIERVVRENPTVRNYLLSNGFGFLDETNRTAAGKALMGKTGATGNHFHFGRDRSARRHLREHLGLNGGSTKTASYVPEIPEGYVFPEEAGRNNPYARQAERMWSKAQPIYQEMLDAGIDPVSAAGILGNMALESGLNPAASNNINGGHWGYLQNDRNITPWIKSNYGGYDHRHQMDYLIAGMQGRLPNGNMGLASRFNGYRDAMRGVTDPEMAAYLWERHYEKSNNEAIPARKGYARYFYDRMMGSNPSIAQQGTMQGEDLAFTPWNSDVFFNGYNQPVPLDIPEAPQQGPVETEAMRAYRQKAEERQQVADNWNKFNFLMQMTSPQQDSSPVDAFGALASSYGASPTSSYSDLGPIAAIGNMFAKGGKKDTQQIPIDLSAFDRYNNWYTPVLPTLPQLPDNTQYVWSEEKGLRPFAGYTVDKDDFLKMQDKQGNKYDFVVSDKRFPEGVIATGLKNPMERANRDAAIEQARKNEEAQRAVERSDLSPLFASIMAGHAALPYAGTVMGTLGRGAATFLSNPWVDAGLTSYFGAEGLQDLANGNANWMTALEVAPLGRLAKPIWNAGKETYNAGKALWHDYRNPLGDPVVPEGFGYPTTTEISAVPADYQSIAGNPARKTSFAFSERPSKLTVREKAGLPKGTKVYTTEENQQFLNQINDFAAKYGYPGLEEGTYSAPELESYARALIDRHNKYYRGVRMPEGEDLEKVYEVIGRNATEDEVLRYVATHPKDNSYLFMSPTSNADMYGEHVAQISIPYNLGPDRTKWFIEGDPTMTGGMTSGEIGRTHDPWVKFYDEYGRRATRTPALLSSTSVPNEVATTNPAVFRQWHEGPLEELSRKTADIPVEQWQAEHVPTITPENAASVTPEQIAKSQYEKIPQTMVRDYFTEINPTDELLQQEARQNTNSAIPLSEFYDGASHVASDKYREAIVKGANDAEGLLYSPGYAERFSKAVEDMMKDPANDHLFSSPEYTLFGEKDGPKTISRKERSKMSKNLWSTKIPEQYYPAGYLESSGEFNDAVGAYSPTEHKIGIDERASMILNNNTPEHEFYHAMRGNFKDDDIIRTNNRKFQMNHSDPYYKGLEEQRVRILSALREMQDAGLDINNLSDAAIEEFLSKPIEELSSNTVDLINNYSKNDIKKALRGFLGIATPAALVYGSQ